MAGFIDHIARERDERHQIRPSLNQMIEWKSQYQTLSDFPVRREQRRSQRLARDPVERACRPGRNVGVTVAVLQPATTA